MIGLHRPQSLSNELAALHSTYKDRLVCIPIDLEQQHTIDAAAHTIAQSYPRIDLLLNVAGILGDGSSTPGPERSIDKIDRTWLTQTLDTNCIGHVMVTKSLIPLLKRKPDDTSLSKIINISARVGSIGDNGLGGWYSYRMSKAALNMFTKTCSVELKRHRCISLSLHPGTTDTDLSVPFQKNVAANKLFPVEYSVAQMLDVVWTAGLDDTGKFYAYDGQVIPW